MQAGGEAVSQGRRCSRFHAEGGAALGALGEIGAPGLMISPGKRGGRAGAPAHGADAARRFCWQTGTGVQRPPGISGARSGGGKSGQYGGAAAGEARGAHGERTARGRSRHHRGEDKYDGGVGVGKLGGQSRRP